MPRSVITPRKAVSLKDVARLAGVSQATASFALNERPGYRIAESTRQRVKEAAERLGYRPNLVARALVRGRTMHIGVSFNVSDHPFKPYYVIGVMQPIWQMMCDKGYQLLLGKGEPDRIAGGLYERRTVDGVFLIAPWHHTDPELVQLAAAGFPCVAIGGMPAGAPRIDYVDLDNRAVGRMQAEYLLGLGHREFAVIGGPTDLVSAARERMDGAIDALRNAACPVGDDRLHTGPFSIQGGRAAMDAALDRGVPFTAALCANDAMAEGAFAALRDRGLHVPGHVSLMGIDGTPPLANDGFPRLTTVVQDFQRIGELAAEAMLERIAAPGLPARVRLIPGALRIADSTAPRHGAGQP